MSLDLIKYHPVWSETLDELTAANDIVRLHQKRKWKCIQELAHARKYFLV